MTRNARRRSFSFFVTANLPAAGLLGIGLSISGCQTKEPAPTGIKAGAVQEESCCPVPEAKTVAQTTPATAPASPAATKPTTVPATSWRSLFDGKTLAGWKSAEFGGQGEPGVEDGNLTLPAGVGITCAVYTGDVPKMNYEVSIEAKRVDGADFFCGLTFPVGKTHASLIIGGWGGSLCGISSLDGNDAAHNETRTNAKLETGKWYTVRLRVLPDRLLAFLDDQKIIDVETKGKEISVRQDIEQSKPFGISSWQTSAAIKSVKVQNLETK